MLGDVMDALWGLLRATMVMRPHAIAAMQLLGKLGGWRVFSGGGRGKGESWASGRVDDG